MDTNFLLTMMGFGFYAQKDGNLKKFLQMYGVTPIQKPVICGAACTLTIARSLGLQMLLVPVPRHPLVMLPWLLLDDDLEDITGLDAADIHAAGDVALDAPFVRAF